MSQEDDKKAAAKAESEKAAANKKADAKVPVYRVVHPHPGTHPVLCGEEFGEGGKLLTEDADLAKSLTEYGCQVFDAETGKHALGTGSEKEQTRIEAARKWAFQK